MRLAELEIVEARSARIGMRCGELPAFVRETSALPRAGPVPPQVRRRGATRLPRPRVPDTADKPDRDTSNDTAATPGRKPSASHPAARVREGQRTLKLGDQRFFVLRAERAAQSLRRLREVAQRSFTAACAEQGDPSRRKRAQIRERARLTCLPWISSARSRLPMAAESRRAGAGSGRDSRRESRRFRFADRALLSHRPLRAVAAVRPRARVRRGEGAPVHVTHIDHARVLRLLSI